MVFPIIYRVSYIPGGAGFRPSTVAPRKDDREWTDRRAADLQGPLLLSMHMFFSTKKQFGEIKVAVQSFKTNKF